MLPFSPFFLPYFSVQVHDLGSQCLQFYEAIFFIYIKTKALRIRLDWE